MKKRIKFALLGLALSASIILGGCTQASRVSHNISRQADEFNVVRKLTAINTRTDKIHMVVTGNFSIGNSDYGELELVCKVGPDLYKKHFIYLNEYMTYSVEDISGADVDPYKFEWIFNSEMFPPVKIEVK